MDPDEALAQIRQHVKDILETEKEEDDLDVMRFAELVQGLDEWISKGGFLPQAWKTSHRA